MTKDNHSTPAWDKITSELAQRRKILNTTITAVLLIQLLCLILLPVLYPIDGFAWFMLLIFFLLTLVLGILANQINRKDAAQLDELEIQPGKSEPSPLEMPIRDPITNLFSKQYLEESLDRELQRSLREHLSIGIIKAKIDQLDPLAAAMGENGKDTALRIVAENLQESIRTSDIACRYEDNEFVLIISDVTQSLTLERAEHLRANVEQVKITDGGQSAQGITLSLGVAMHPIHGTASAELMGSADRALQHAAENGGNQVVIYQKELN